MKLGGLSLNHLYALARSWLPKVNKIKCATLLMSLSVIGFLITCYRKNKLNCQLIMLYRSRNNSKSMHMVNGIAPILILVMIVMFFVDSFNWP
jgi:hypothetical protein